MFTSKKARVIVVSATALAIVAGATVATSAFAAAQPNGSDAAVYIGDPNTGAVVPAGSTLNYNDDYIGFTDPANITTPFVCPTDATGSVTFVSAKGQERTIGSYLGTGTSLFAPGTKNLIQPTTSLYAQSGTNYAQVKNNGGDYSVGVACTNTNGVKLASSGVWFASIHVTAGSGAFTVDQPTTTTTPTPTPTSTSTPGSVAGTSNLTLKATTVAATDGVLSLVAPTNTTVLIGNAVVDPTTHLSTSTGTLGNVTVSDGRIVTHKGWDLTTSVTDFALEGDSTKTIDKKQLGFTPVLVSTPSGATGITKATAQVAGSAAYVAPFASADNGSIVGSTVLNANLTFVAPAAATPGTYDSTLTLTLTSK